MSDRNGNADKPSAGSNTEPLSDPVKIREEAREKAKSTDPPDLDSMTNEEIQKLFYEKQVKRLEAKLENESLRSRLENYKSQADILATITGYRPNGSESAGGGLVFF